MIDGLKNSKNSHFTQINDKKVILDIDSGKYYLLNNIGALVWDFIQSDTNLSLEEVSDQLAKNFDQKKEVITKEIQDFIESISKFGLIS
jgi:hypothetical protein